MITVPIIHSGIRMEKAKIQLERQGSCACWFVCLLKRLSSPNLRDSSLSHLLRAYLRYKDSKGWCAGWREGAELNTAPCPGHMLSSRQTGDRAGPCPTRAFPPIHCLEPYRCRVLPTWKVPPSHWLPPLLLNGSPEHHGKKTSMGPWQTLPPAPCCPCW